MTCCFAVWSTGNRPFHAKARNQVRAALSRAGRTVVVARAPGDDESPRRTSRERQTGEASGLVHIVQSAQINWPSMEFWLVSVSNVFQIDDISLSF